MSQTKTASMTATYTDIDVENVVRRVKADLVMIADSTGGWTAEKARDYAHDVELLAKAGYLEYVDVTLYSNNVEVKATRFNIDTDAGSLTSSRPGGVLWPKVVGASLRMILGYSDAYLASGGEATKGKLKISWSLTNADTSHSSLTSTGGRDYASNSFGMKRKDWTS